MDYISSLFMDDDFNEPTPVCDYAWGIKIGGFLNDISKGSSYSEGTITQSVVA